MGDFETCELCDGTGSVNPHKPTGPIGHLKLYVMEARYAAGVPLIHPEDSWNPRPRGQEEETEQPASFFEALNFVDEDFDDES